MDAVVTLKLTPKEFDLLRKAVDSLISEDYEITKKSELPAPVRAAAREQHVLATDLRSKLR
jgi:propanediol utilization protein